MNRYDKYNFTKIEESLTDGFRCISDNYEGKLCISAMHDEVRYYPKPNSKLIVTKDDEYKDFIIPEIKIDTLTDGESRYNVVKRIYTNYSAINPASNKASKVYSNGVDLVRFVACLKNPKRLPPGEILHNVGKVKEEKGVKIIDYDDFDIYIKQDDTVKTAFATMIDPIEAPLFDMLKSENIASFRTAGSIKAQLSTVKAFGEKVISGEITDEKIKKEEKSFKVAGGIFYRPEDVEEDVSGSSKLLAYYEFKVNPPLKFQGDPSLDRFALNSTDLRTLMIKNKVNIIYKNDNARALLTPRNAILGRLVYLTYKQPSWDLINGRNNISEDGNSEALREISDEFFKNDITSDRTLDRQVHPDDIPKLENVDVSDRKFNTLEKLEGIINYLKDNDDEFPSNFLQEATSLQYVLKKSSADDIDEVVLDIEKLEEKISNYEEVVQEEDLEDVKTYKTKLNELKKIYKDLVNSKKRSLYDDLISKKKEIDDIFEGYTDDTAEKYITMASKITLNDDLPMEWSKVTANGLSLKPGSYNGQPILFERPPEKPSDEWLNSESPEYINTVPEGTPIFDYIDIADNKLYYAEDEDKLISGETIDIKIPSEIWVYVPKEYKVGALINKDNDSLHNSRPFIQSKSGAKEVFIEELNGADVWEEYNKYELNSIDQTEWLNRQLPAAKKFIVRKLVEEFNGLSDYNDKINFILKRYKGKKARADFLEKVNLTPTEKRDYLILTSPRVASKNVEINPQYQGALNRIRFNEKMVEYFNNLEDPLEKVEFLLKEVPDNYIDFLKHIGLDSANIKIYAVLVTNYDTRNNDDNKGKYSELLKKINSTESKKPSVEESFDDSEENKEGYYKFLEKIRDLLRESADVNLHVSMVDSTDGKEFAFKFSDGSIIELNNYSGLSYYINKYEIYKMPTIFKYDEVLEVAEANSKHITSLIVSDIILSGEKYSELRIDINNKIETYVLPHKDIDKNTLDTISTIRLYIENNEKRLKEDANKIDEKPKNIPFEKTMQYIKDNAQKIYAESSFYEVDLEGRYTVTVRLLKINDDGKKSTVGKMFKLGALTRSELNELADYEIFKKKESGANLK